MSRRSFKEGQFEVCSSSRAVLPELTLPNCSRTADSKDCLNALHVLIGSYSIRHRRAQSVMPASWQRYAMECCWSSRQPKHLRCWQKRPFNNLLVDQFWEQSSIEVTYFVHIKETADRQRTVQVSL